MARFSPEESPKAGARLGRSLSVGVWELIKIWNGEVDLPTQVARDVRAARVVWGRSSLLMCRLLVGPQTTDNVVKSDKLQEF